MWPFTRKIVWEVETVRDDVTRSERCARATFGGHTFVVSPSDIISGYDWFAFFAGDEVPISFGHCATMDDAQRACEAFR